MDTKAINGNECSTLVSLAEDMISKREAKVSNLLNLVKEDFFNLRQEHNIEPYAIVGNCSYYLIADTERIRRLYIEKRKLSERDVK